MLLKQFDNLSDLNSNMHFSSELIKMCMPQKTFKNRMHLNHEGAFARNRRVNLGCSAAGYMFLFSPPAFTAAQDTLEKNLIEADAERL